MGFAIDQPGDELELILTDTKEVRIVEITGDNGVLPRNPSRNSATVAIIDFWLILVEISE